MEKRPAKPPYFPFYVGDFLSSRAVAQLTVEQIGAYTLLLCWQWDDAECSLPADPGVLGYLSRLGDRWQEVGPKIVELCFKRRGVRIWNERLRSEREKYESVVSLRSVAGKKGGLKSGASRRKGTEANTKHLLPFASVLLEANVKQNEANQNQNQNQNQIQSQNGLNGSERAANPLVNRARLIPEGYAAIAEIVRLTGHDPTEVLERNSKPKDREVNYRGAVRLDDLKDDRLARTVHDLKAELARLKLPTEPVRSKMPWEKVAERVAQEGKPPGERGTN